MVFLVASGFFKYPVMIDSVFAQSSPCSFGPSASPVPISTIFTSQFALTTPQDPLMVLGNCAVHRPPSSVIPKKKKKKKKKKSYFSYHSVYQRVSRPFNLLISDEKVDIV